MLANRDNIVEHFKFPHLVIFELQQEQLIRFTQKLLVLSNYSPLFYVYC